MIRSLSPSLSLVKTKNTCFYIRSLRTFTSTKFLLKNEQQFNEYVTTNAANVQLLSPSLHHQVFPSKSSTVTNLTQREALSKEHLTLQDIWGKKSDSIDPINLKLPGLYGDNIEEHFMRIGLEQTSNILNKAERLANIDLPPLPNSQHVPWRRQAGWTRYDGITGKVEAVDYPLGDALVFDVEVLVTEGHFPTMAVAASSEAWYTWTSPYLITGDKKDQQALIPMGGNNGERLLVGHNVGYDRARIAEEYSRLDSGIKYVDTMSLHIAVAGLCSQQRPAWNSALKKQQEKAESTTTTTPEQLSLHGQHQGNVAGHDSFFDVSAHNSLKDVAKFHCGLEMDKTQRSYFVDGTLQDIQENFNDLMTYCAQDVLTTHKVYQKVLPKFRENCPHPISFGGMVQMGSSFLTVTEKWERYLEKSVQKHKELEDMLDVKLQHLADQARELVDSPEQWQADPWLCQLEWLVNPRQRKLKGAPKWYKDAYDTKAGKLKITTRSRVAPLLLRLKWQGYPLHYLPRQGWCYKVKHDQELNEVHSKKTPILRDDTYSYFKVPHKDGEDANCGNPLAKNYIDAYEDNTLSSEYDAAKEALELNAKSAYWISSRERILGQFVVWDDNNSVNLALPKQLSDDNNNDNNFNKKYGMILPQMVAMGTVTRRAVERTWLTASNAKANRIGSELKSMVQAPEGYKIVGADVDSEELWISSVIGDAQFGFHGATALGWMTLQGTKSEGTDLHSKTAAILGISRNKAKIFNYARIYGAGVKYATSLLLQYSQGMDTETAKTRALDLYSSTKGEKEHRKRNPFKRIFWHGGSESYMFNALEDIALSDDPRTPVLGCAVTDALKPKYTKDKFLTSRINWVVQSSGVDYLHMLLVSMSHLIERYNIDARFMLSVHDEVRYLSSVNDQHRTALALQVANLWTRAMFSYKLGIHNLPQSIAFFSAVDLDHVLRKEPTMTCTTPSHEEEIAVGDTYEILDTIKTLEQQTKHDDDDDDDKMDCLLGKGNTTLGKTLASSTVQEALAHMQHIQGTRRTCDIDFLKAQMYKDYRNKLEPSVDGSKETEEHVNNFDPTIMQMEAEQHRQQKHDMAANDTDELPSPPDFDVSSSSISTSHNKRGTSKRPQQRKWTSSSPMSSTSVIVKPYSSMIPTKQSLYKQRPTATNNRYQGPDAYFAGKNVYLARS
ncbi:DNA polymerase family A-domain-containing protein [Chlamydoabsidia padenii]|nr:DNA polymerase family A-domain-containing protein [Chlamydoabsidia padenii]